jgi:hypothetical protein
VHATFEHGQRGTGITGQEHGVGQSTLVRWAIGPPRRLDKTVSVRVDADCQNFRTRSRESGDRRNVARSEIDDYPFEAADQCLQLSDVELGPLTSNDHVHGGRIIAHPCAAYVFARRTCTTAGEPTNSTTS